MRRVRGVRSVRTVRRCESEVRRTIAPYAPCTCYRLQTVHPDLDRLIRLQALDSRVAEARKLQTSIPDTQRALDQKLDGARAAVAAAKDQQAANQTSRRDLEKDLSAVNTRLSRYKDQLMEVKTNREYQAMQHEIAVAQNEVKALEEKVLERMLEADEPYVLDVIVPYTEHVLPFIPAGRTVADMIWHV